MQHGQHTCSPCVASRAEIGLFVTGASLLLVLVSGGLSYWTLRGEKKERARQKKGEPESAGSVGVALFTMGLSFLQSVAQARNLGFRLPVLCVICVCVCVYIITFFSFCQARSGRCAVDAGERSQLGNLLSRSGLCLSPVWTEANPRVLG